MKHKLLIVGILSFIILLAFVPKITTLYLNNAYPFVSFSSLEFSLNGIILNDVIINKENLIIKSPKLLATRSFIDFQGGTLDLIINENKSKETKPNDIKITGFFNAASVYNKDWFVVLNNITIHSISNIDFEKIQGNIQYETYDITIEGKNGSFNKDLFLSSALIEINQQKFKTKNLKANVNEKTINIKSIDFKYGSVYNLQASYKNDVLHVYTDSSFIYHEVIFSKPITLKSINTYFYKEDNKAEIEVGNLRFDLYLDEKRIVGKNSCQEYLNNLPREMVINTPLADNPELKGNIEFDISLDPPNFELKYGCSVVSKCTDLKNLMMVKSPFLYMAYGENKQDIKRESGPGSKEWVPYSSMSPHLSWAVISLEDPAYLKHQGVLSAAFKNSFFDNIKTNKFLRGGSTITMQTVKNIWLSRDKNIGRKAQEVFISTMLETCFSKTQILELYLNVIEYSKSLYGIANGSNYYFQKAPSQLDPVECFFIASILPYPRSAKIPTEQSLELIENFMYKLKLQ